MSKNFYIEEYSGDFSDFDYFLNAELKGSVTVVITAFLNHPRISFGYMINDFKCLLCSLEEYYRNTKYDSNESKTTPDGKEFEIKMSPDDSEVTVLLYHDFDTQSLLTSFVYAVGYVQSFMLHRGEYYNEDFVSRVE